MKNVIKFSLMLFSFAFLAYSCEKEENESEQKDNLTENIFTFNGEEVNLTQALIQDHGYCSVNCSQDLYNFDLYLLTSDYTIPEGTAVKAPSGTGKGLLFQMYTEQKEKLAVGEYRYDRSGYIDGTFWDSKCYNSYDIENWQGNVSPISSGKVNIVKNDGEYEITIDCVAKDGTVVKGTFKGAISTQKL